MLKTEAKPQTETEKLFALDKPSLENLSYCLRHPETWPKGFHWNYSQCRTCAMGLARALWSEKIEFSTKTDDANEKAATVVAREFALPYSAAADIFLGHGSWVPRMEKVEGYLWWKERSSVQDWDLVLPEMVADQIDKHLAESK